ncbi:MAG TPA: LexA family transcriptional regulator [Marinagarivorans sp.]
MKSSHSTAERITSLRTQLGLSQKEFAEHIGITQGALSQLESGKSTLSLQTITRISQVFNIDCNWLVLGDSKSLQSDTGPIHNSSMLSTDPSYNDAKRKWLSELNLIPLIAEEAHAGYIKQCGDEDYLETLEVYRIPGFESGNYRMFEIEGDSMVPTIHPREIVVTELVSNWDAIENGALSVIIADDGIVAKRVYRYDEDASSFLLKSDNPDYKTYSLKCSEVKEIWQIKAKITNVLSNDSHVSAERFKSIESDIMELKEQLSKISAPEEAR